MVMGIAVQITKQATVALGFTLTRAYGVLAQAVAATVVAILTYAIFSVLFKLDEASLLVRAANKMGLRRSGGTV
jgi:hypothetical protein